MHYILLAIALNLGKENIDYMKLADMRKLTNVEKAEVEKNKEEIKRKEEEAVLPPLPADFPVADQSFLNDSGEEFTVPYVGSNDFAELLPEDEIGNVIDDSEEQGPKFLENIKNRLISVTDKKKAEIIIGSQVEGPSFFDNIKNKLLNTEPEKPKVAKKDEPKKEEPRKEEPKKEEPKENGAADENVGPNIFDSFKENIVSKVEKTTGAAKEKQTPSTENKAGGTAIIDKIKDKTAEAGDKIKAMEIKKPDFISSIQNKFTGKKEIKEEDLDKIKIVGTLFDSELNQALKDQRVSEYREMLNSKDYSDSKKIDYMEDEAYQKFLNEKELSSLVKPEKIFVPNIKPRAKEMVVYKQDVAKELLEPRSFQNRHIPKIMQKKDSDDVLEKVIEYGMMPEFRAYMNELRDSNTVMSNQYTLLTYATKHKQYPIMKYLIHIGANVNKRDDRLDTPLGIAVQNNDMEAVKILLNANANPDMVDVLKRTPLIYCIEKNQEPIGIYLIEKGANVNIANGVGEGTLAMSIRLGRNLIKEKIIGVLRDKGR